MFQLDREEFTNLKSQIVTSSWGGLRRATGCGGAPSTESDNSGNVPKLWSYGAGGDQESKVEWGANGENEEG